jgi:MFS family permease
LPDDPRSHLLNRNIRLLLGTVGLLSGSLFGSYAVLMNLFLLRLGFGPAFIGLVNGIGMLCWAIAAPFAGASAKRFGYRRLMLVGLGSVFVGSSLLPFGASFSGDVRAVWLVTAYSFAAAGAGTYFANWSPFIMGAVAPRLRSRAFALAMATFPTAGFAGSLIGGFLPGLFGGLVGVGLNDPAAYRYALHLAGFVVLPSILLVAATTEVKTVRRDSKSGDHSRTPFFAIAVMTVLGILLAFGEGSVRIFFNTYMDGFNVDTATIGMTFALSQLFVGPLALLSPLISGRVGTGRTVFVATVGIATSLVGMALIASPAAAVTGLIIVFAFGSLMRPALSLHQMELVRPEFWGLMSGFVTLSWGLGSGSTALIGGVLVSSFGYDSLFLVGATISGLAAILFGLFLIVHRTPLPDGDRHTHTAAAAVEPPAGPVG